MENVLEVSEVEKAVVALKECIEKVKEKQKKKALIEEENVAMQFSCKLAVNKNQRIKVVLPHPPKRDACLFVKDIDRRNREYKNTISAYKDILRDNKITEQIEVFPLKKLKLEYTDYEAKRNLCSLHEVFLADARIARLVPSFLGSTFIKRKKFVLQVRLDAKDLKTEIETVLGTTQCILSGKGSTSQVVVGKLDQDSADIARNIITCFTELQSKLPGGLQNIRNVQIKCGDSPAVPLYVSYDSKSDVLSGKEEKEEKEGEEGEDVATVMNGKVLVKNGKIIILRSGEKEKKKRKGEVQTGKAAKKAKTN